MKRFHLSTLSVMNLHASVFALTNYVKFEPALCYYITIIILNSGSGS